MTKPVRLTLGIGFAGVVCALLATAAPLPLAWLMGWTAFSCFVVSFAYATNRPGVFGKRAGRLSPARTFLLLPYLVAFWVACALMRARRRADPWHEVAPGLYVGGRMRGADLPPGVALIVDLAGELGEPAELRRHPGYRCLPVLDGSHPPDEAAFCRLLVEVSATPGGVLFHCESGKGRAPTAAALALVARGIVGDAESALELVRKGRPTAAPTRSDAAFVRRIVAKLDADSGR